ncbi:MAG TPA: 16S rRNA (guanine(966)-N(2))-methyltransferase RsmD [Pseudomonadales bacterium]
MASNEVRIIGGNFRGRKLVFPERRDLRPTLGRVRETLFNWLAADIPGSRCLDLFAGSGALGLEAASRGAASVTLVESDRKVAARLKENVARFGAVNVRVICDRAERVLRRGGGPWDVIFLDPPFQQARLGEMLALILETGALAEEGLVYVEAPRREPLTTGEWRTIREGLAGDTRFALLATP